MSERINAIENLLKILSKNHEIVIKSDLPAKEVIEVVDFIRQFASNLTNELSDLKKQAESKQDDVKVIEPEVVTSPSVGSTAA